MYNKVPVPMALDHGITPQTLADLEGAEALVLKGHTARTIIDHTTGNAVDCIVTGSHKPDLRDCLLGSTAGRVMRHAPCAVHVQRTRH
ncbi:MAG: universal stress protein [Paracoccaceae bacterium]